MALDLRAWVEATYLVPANVLYSFDAAFYLVEGVR